MTIYHIHHIIPKHMGGTDDPSNLIQLTIEEHAEAHRKLWEEHGNEYDRAAWLGLSSQIGKDEILSLVLSEAGKRSYQKSKESWNKRRKLGTEYCRGKKAYHNPTNPNEYKLFDEGTQPKGWILGRNVKSTVDTNWYYNDKTGETRMFRDDEVLYGWKRGRGNTINYKTVLGKCWYHDPISMKSKFFHEGEEPLGWMKGRK